MKKPRRKFKVYIKRSGWGVYGDGTDYHFAGETYAVSERQAVNNVRFRTEGKTPNNTSVGDILGEGEVFYEYMAVLA